MTPADTLRLLTLAAAYDPTVLPSDPDERRIRAEAWAAAINTRITYTEAQAAIVDHYATSRDRVTVADINHPAHASLPPGYYTQAELADGAGIHHQPQPAAPHTPSEPTACCGRRHIHTTRCPVAANHLVTAEQLP